MFLVLSVVPFGTSVNEEKISILFIRKPLQPTFSVKEMY